MFERMTPELPQHASPHEQSTRGRQLADARASWTWTTQVQTLPGVPLAAKVPPADEPNVPWLLLVVEVGLEVVTNVLANKLGEAGGAASPSTHPELERIREEAREIRDIHEGQSAGESIVEGLFDLARGAVADALGTHTGRLRTHLDTLRRLAATQGPPTPTDQDLAAYEALFRTLPRPAIAGSFHDDATFARLRVAGPNPTLLRGVDAPPAGFALAPEDYARVVPGDSLAAAGAEGRLYLVDYAELASMAPGATDGRPKHLACPLALFAVPPGRRSLVPVALRLGQGPGPVYLPPASGRSWTWEMAKLVVEVADGNYHELYAHLGRTHLVLEAVAVAMHRSLAEAHPLHVLLTPHVQGTLFINAEAAGGLIAAGGPIDRIFAGTIGSVQLAAAHDRLRFDFSARRLPRDLAERRVDDPARLPDYPYRDDALRVWGALQRWARAYVGVYYLGDEDVVGDPELAAFCAELRGAGLLRGFPQVGTLDELVDALTMILFTASAQHAAVTFPQRTIMSFAPAMTGATWAPGPEGVPDDESSRTRMLPPVDLALEQLDVLWLLGGVHSRRLGDYRAAEFPYGPWFQDERVVRDGGPLARFREDLAEVEAAIQKDNSERAVPYPYLLLSAVPESINI